MDKKNSTTHVKNFGSGIMQTSRKTKWLITTDAPKCPEDLHFVGRDSAGRIIWWNVTPPNTDYWGAHQSLGKAYAFELLDMVNNPEAEFPPHVLAYVTDAIRRWSPGVSHCAAEGMTHGFFGVLSEYISTGTANR